MQRFSASAVLQMVFFAKLFQVSISAQRFGQNQLLIDTETFRRKLSGACVISLYSSRLKFVVSANFTFKNSLTITAIVVDAQAFIR